MSGLLVRCEVSIMLRSGTRLKHLVSERKTMRGRTWLTLGLTAFLSAPSFAFGQSGESGQADADGDLVGGVIYKKKTVVSFGDDTIDGDLTRPDHGYIESRKRVRHSNLIRIRDNFREKILNSFVDI